MIIHIEIICENRLKRGGVRKLKGNSGKGKVEKNVEEKAEGKVEKMWTKGENKV